MEKVTIYEIAKKVGTSPATVSRAIHSPHMLSPKTLERIQAAMKESNYSYNAAAANFSRGSSSTIHVVIPVLGSSVFSSTVMGVQEVAFRHKLSVVVSSTNYDKNIELDLLKQALEQRCAGALLTGFCKDNMERVRALAEKDLPLVVMWEKASADLNSVGFDNYAVSKKALSYLFSLGHRRIGCLFGPYSIFHRAQLRLDAYRDLLAEYDVAEDPALYLEGRPTIDDGKRGMTKLLSLKDVPTAVFCTNDLQAIGAYDVIRRAGLRIPDDISVFGFDDIEVSPYMFPPLDTVHVPGYDIGRLSAQRLLEMLGTPGLEPVQQIVETPLLYRGSCAAPAR